MPELDMISVRSCFWLFDNNIKQSNQKPFLLDTMSWVAPWFHELGRDNIKTASELHKVVAKVLLLVVLGQLGAPFLFLLVVRHVRKTIGTRISARWGGKKRQARLLSLGGDISNLLSWLRPKCRSLHHWCWSLYIFFKKKTLIASIIHGGMEPS